MKQREREEKDQDIILWYYKQTAKEHRTKKVEKKVILN